MALRRRYSRYRKNSRKRFTRRFKKRRTYCCSKPEVKTTHLKSMEQALKISYTSSDDHDYLWNHQNLMGGIWTNVTQGTDYHERIGNTISAIGMRMRFLCVGCPSSTSYDVTDFYLRFIVWVGDNVANTNYEHFFATTGKINFHKPVNRKNVHQVLFDRVMKVTSSWNATQGDQMGPVLYKNLYIPFKRRIVYNITGGVKDDKNRVNVAMLLGTPGLASNVDERQIGCITTYSTLYYTDA